MIYEATKENNMSDTDKEDPPKVIVKPNRFSDLAGTVTDIKSETKLIKTKQKSE